MGSSDESSSLKKAAIAIAVFLGTLTIVIASVTYCRFLCDMPPSPTLDKDENLQSFKLEIENYEHLSSVVKGKQGYLYELLITNFAKPLLIGIVSYIFGQPIVTATATRIRASK